MRIIILAISLLLLTGCATLVEIGKKANCEYTDGVLNCAPTVDTNTVMNDNV